MKSLKARLMYGMIGGVVLLLIGFDFIVYNAISRTLYSQFDASLESVARLISASVEWKDDELDFEFDVKMTPEFTGGTTLSYYELWGDDGVAIGKSPSLGDSELFRFDTENHPHVFKTFRMKDGRSVRAIAMKFMPRVDKDNKKATVQSFTLVVARDAGILLSHLHFLKSLFLIASIAITALACVIVAIVVKKVLTPLSSVAGQIEHIREDSLKSRIVGENLPTEIAPIQKQLNSLLERLEASFERERSFNANVAHELRTPLAGMRSIIDVTLMRNRDAAEYHSALSESLSIIKNMEEMVVKLLTLARIESGQIKFNTERIILGEMIDKCWRYFSEKALAAGIVFENHLQKDLVCESDAAGLSIIVSNLLDNAVEYTNRNGRIWVTARKMDNSVDVVFENTGNQLTEEQMKSVFDCYWQGDTSRSRTGVHFGLGLAMVKQMVELLGGKIRVEAPNGLFSIHISLPIAKDSL